MKRLFSRWRILSLITILVLLVCDCEKPKRVIKLLTLNVRSQDISYEQVIIKGEIIDIGDVQPDDHGIMIKNLTASTMDFTTISLGPINTEGIFTATFTNPVPSNLYEYKAYAQSGTNIVSGETKTFTSLAVVIPVLTTAAVSEITVTAAISGGNITSDGGSEILSRGICWNTNENPNTSDSKTIDPNPGTGNFTNNMSGLNPGTTYYVRAYASNSAGLVYGNQVSFSTSGGVPELTSIDALNITHNSATAGGSFISDGGLPVTDRGICWNTSGSPTISDEFRSDGTTGTGSYTTNFDGLQPMTTYYLRAYATNMLGTGYGHEVSFTTVMEIITGTFTDNRDGKVYNWTQIGDQKWMAENLAYLPEVSPASINGAFWTLYYVYDYQSDNVSEAINTDNYSLYGVLYNWNAAMNNSVSNNDNPGAIQGICPDVWHIPSEAEWQEMESYLGMSETDLEIEGLRGDIGGKLKEEGTTHWLNTNIGATNITSFNALPGGMLDAKDTESFIDLANTAYWWSSTIIFDGSYDSWSRSLQNNNTAIGRNADFIASGLSVRCVEGQGANLAVVITHPAENITQNGATLSGWVSDDKHGFVTERGIYFSTVDEPPEQNGIKVSLGTDVGTFSTDLTVLAEGQTYYFNTFATNIAGTSFGEVKVFTTPQATIATLTTIDASNISASSVISGGNISNDGGSEVTDRGVCYSTSPNPYVNSNLIQDGNNGIGAYNCTIDNLTPGTRYYLRSYATNSAGTAYGNELEIITSPLIQTTPVTNTWTTSAKTGGQNVSLGSLTATEKGICWGTSTDPTITDNKIMYDDGSSGENPFVIDITGLDQGTTYHVRAYLITNTGTFYGENLSFTTESVATVTSTAITNITKNSAISGGNVTSPGSGIVNERGVCWNTSGNPTTDDDRTSDGSGTGEFTSNISGLSAGTTYHVRAYATNELGPAYGEELIFTTYYGLVSDYDGNDYYTIQIGSQIWMAENLMTTHYADGTVLIDGKGAGDITGNYSTKYYFASDDDESNVAAYGRLYTWAAVMNGSLSSDANPSGVQGVCPDGWHVPSDAEWKELETYLGMSMAVADLSGWRGTSEGNLLKSTSGWNSDGNGSNESGFTGLPGGSRYSDGSFYNIGEYAGIWSASEASEYSTLYGWYRCLFWENSDVFRYSYYKDQGRSVRCIEGQAGSLPIVSTDSPANITQNSATVGGNASDDGGATITDRGIYYSTTQNPETTGTKLQIGSGTGIFSGSLTGLTAGTEYYIKAYATNSIGTSYGAEMNFTTLTTPTLTTTAVSNITNNSAESGANISDDGGAVVTVRGVCWNTTGNPTLTDKIGFTSDGSGTGTFTSNITALNESTTYYVAAYATNSVGTSYGAVETLTTATSPVTDYDGNIYQTVQIGNQVWMAENLKVIHYSNGTAIPLVEGTSAWDALSYTDTAYCYYDNLTSNKDIYGALYTWAAAMNGAASSSANPSGIQGVCPTGWHLPGDAEWKELEMELGMSQADADATGYRGTNEGSKLAGNEALWDNGTLDSNAEFGTSGFTALPGGYRNYDGTFRYLGYSASFWSATEDSSSGAWSRSLYSDHSGVRWYTYNKDSGFSVRCLKD